ncbi:aquaporin [Punctularia strigosozonata HHB-11173 SS5]|uniref:aquaporin n=1 Tax=Punctularia strigosozonata (strain HHB-11173) TaxID=741275 RepID=UPI0004417E1E|nr:aquaporin [Punctularia strigosozonata HHB-11173 SS5]EIN12530.1 aquaporin [Punctularia strigosozonata HHB-11173 SS5]
MSKSWRARVPFHHSEKEKNTTSHIERTFDNDGSDGTMISDHVSLYPNRWAKFRSYIREYAAEFLATMIMIIFGNGVDCQVVLSGSTAVASSQKGSYLSISFGWACGVALGVWVTGGISGAHLNPAITIMLATFRDFPWRKVPGYCLAQLLGAWVGALVIYANYFHAIDLFEGGKGVRTVPGTASLFATYAADYMTSVSCFFDEFIGTVVLVIVVLAISDKTNGPPPPGLNALVLFILILGIGAALGMETAYAINPARDLGPRIMTAMVGYGKDVFTYRNQYWLWCPIIAPIAGALVGAAIYDGFIFEGSESIVNRPNKAARLHHEHAPAEEQQLPPAGAYAV